MKCFSVMADATPDPTWARILEIARMKGWTRDDVIDAAKVKQPTYWKWDNGTQSLSRESCAKIASALGVSLDLILDPAAEVPSNVLRGGATSKNETRLLAVYRSGPVPRRVLDAVVRAFTDEGE